VAKSSAGAVGTQATSRVCPCAHGATLRLPLLRLIISVKISSSVVVLVLVAEVSRVGSGTDAALVSTIGVHHDVIAAAVVTDVCGWY